MSENLKNFLKTMAEDPEKKARFEKDPHAVMDEHGLSEEHKKMIISRDKDRIKEEAGLEDADTNMLIG